MLKSLVRSKKQLLTACLAGSLLLSGCANWPSSQTNDPLAQPAPIADPQDLAPISAPLAGYDDIELPIEMKQGQNMAIRTDSFRGGVYEYEGKVEIGSLKEYISTSMQNKGWKLAGEADYDKVMLAFIKPQKTCLVLLENGSGVGYSKTYAHFYVTYETAGASPSPSPLQ